jgi:hypothetical protein
MPDMMTIPPDILASFDKILKKREIPAQFHLHYRKWLRYFLDSCHKYPPPEPKSEQVRLFIDKLRSKKQSANLCKQAAHAVSLYFESRQTSQGEEQNAKQPSAHSPPSAYQTSKAAQTKSTLGPGPGP